MQIFIANYSMKSLKNLLLTFTLSVILFSCEKKEEPYPPALIQSHSANIGSKYQNHAFFNVNTNEFVKIVEHKGYDLNFTTGNNDKHIYLNSSNTMFVRNKGVISFESVKDTSGIEEWAYDFPTGEEHKTAIGEWFNTDGTSKGEVFILNRGVDEVGKPLGFLKFKVESVNAVEYKIRVAELDGTKDRIVTIAKNSDKARVQFSFTDDAVKDIEPDKNNWHLVFTQYTDYDLTTEGDTLPYSVRGVLLNRYNTEAIKITDIDFEDIYLDMMPAYTFSSNQNVIGWDWKYFSFDSGFYTIVSGYSYVVKNEYGNYFKLRFLDFYNDEGVKGFPQFEIVEL